jgi:hypothetical protein
MINQRMSQGTQKYMKLVRNIWEKILNRMISSPRSPNRTSGGRTIAIFLLTSGIALQNMQSSVPRRVQCSTGVKNEPNGHIMAGD